MVRRTLLVLLLLAAAGGAAFAVYESRTSAFEARFFADLTKKLTYRVGKGPSDAIRFRSRRLTSMSGARSDAASIPAAASIATTAA